jgi:hypothetical protein
VDRWTVAGEELAVEGQGLLGVLQQIRLQRLLEAEGEETPSSRQPVAQRRISWPATAGGRARRRCGWATRPGSARPPGRASARSGAGTARDLCAQEAQVTGEQLVAAVAVQRHRHVLAGEPETT